jgi:hypothetical protein
MKKSLMLFIVMCLIVLSSTSCKTLGIFGKSSKDQSKQGHKIDDVVKLQSDNTQKKIENIAVISSGVDYTISKITNKEPAVSVAKDLNRRIMSLSGQPDLEYEKEMWKMVDELTSTVDLQRELGKKALERKDKEISLLQITTKELSTQKEEEILKYRKLATDTAALADTRKVELDSYEGWFGLKAVFKGGWKFIKSMTWILIGFTILFLVLRAFASSNPIAGAIFSIFEQIAAGAIHLIQGIAPKAAQFAKFVPQVHFDGFQQTLDKLVDTIELLKDNQSRSGKKYTLDEVLLEVSKAMSDEDKARIELVKKNTGW